MAAAVMAMAVLAGTAVLVRPWPHTRPLPGAAAQPAVIAEALASYRAERLPGTAVPAEPAPMLTPLTLRLVGAARGELGGVAVTIFAYRTPSGERLTILGQQPAIPRSRPSTGTRQGRGRLDDAIQRVTIICAQHTHAMLLLGSDPALVRQAGTLLNAI